MDPDGHQCDDAVRRTVAAFQVLAEIPSVKSAEFVIGQRLGSSRCEWCSVGDLIRSLPVDSRMPRVWVGVWVGVFGELIDMPVRM